MEHNILLPLIIFFLTKNIIKNNIISGVSTCLSIAMTVDKEDESVCYFFTSSQRRRNFLNIKIISF